VTFFFFAPLLIPVFILGVPLIDAVWAFVRRTVSGQGFHTPDKNHIHHRLMRLGHGHKRTVVILWLWTAVLCGFVLLPLFDRQANVFIPLGGRASVDRSDDVVQPLVNRLYYRGEEARRDARARAGERLSGRTRAPTPSEQRMSRSRTYRGCSPSDHGHDLAMIIAVFVVLGIWADRAWGTAPWGLLIGITLGTVAAVVSW